MAFSMTGFGSGKASNDQFQITVEMKSVNHRYFECIVRLPRQMMAFEDKIKKIVQNEVARGRIEVFVNVSGSALTKKQVKADWDIIDQLSALSKEFYERQGSERALSFSDIIRVQDAVSFVDADDENTEIETMLTQSTAEAVQNLKNMREVEGNNLLDDMRSQLVVFRKSLDQVTLFAPKVVEQYRTRLSQKLEEAVGEKFDQARLLTEITIFTDKTDITEELTRLASHMEQFDQIILEEVPIGRKLDFLLQEMNRETNTIGSKANDALIAKEVVEMKTTLEKMKEQVQNIE
ncbi:MAG: YicC family protein [Bacillales bacterium]|jgi:uncharacterized protein (TIGR00255 family)|nr:YicC family protein [Bacillales bacterium]